MASACNTEVLQQVEEMEQASTHHSAATDLKPETKRRRSSATGGSERTGGPGVSRHASAHASAHAPSNTSNAPEACPAESFSAPTSKVVGGGAGAGGGGGGGGGDAGAAAGAGEDAAAAGDRASVGDLCTESLASKLKMTALCRHLTNAVAQMARQPVSTNVPRQAGGGGEGGGGVSTNTPPLAQRADRANALAQAATAEDEQASSSHAPIEHKQQVAGQGKEGKLAACSPLASKKAEKAMIVRVVGETSTSSGGYLHRSKAIMAFEEERGKDLVILALYVN